MNLTDIKTLVDYHYWARDRMLDAVDRLTPEQYTQRMGGSFRSVRDTVVHIYSAEWLWYSRWQGEMPTAMLDSSLFPDTASVRTAWLELEKKVRRFVGELDEGRLAEVVGYKTLGGDTWESVMWHMIQHLVNHAAYHRGQVTTLLRQLHAKPPLETDLIVYYRQHSNLPEAAQ